MISPESANTLELKDDELTESANTPEVDELT